MSFHFEAHCSDCEENGPLIRVGHNGAKFQTVKAESANVGGDEASAEWGEWLSEHQFHQMGLRYV